MDHCSLCRFDSIPKSYLYSRRPLWPTDEAVNRNGSSHFDFALVFFGHCHLFRYSFHVILIKVFWLLVIDSLSQTRYTLCGFYSRKLLFGFVFMTLTIVLHYNYQLTFYDLGTMFQREFNGVIVALMMLIIVWIFWFLATLHTTRYSLLFYCSLKESNSIVFHLFPHDTNNWLFVFCCSSQ